MFSFLPSVDETSRLYPSRTVSLESSQEGLTRLEKTVLRGTAPFKLDSSVTADRLPRLDTPDGRGEAERRVSWMGEVRDIVGSDAPITGVLHLEDLDSFALATEKRVYLWKRTELFCRANTITTQHDVCLLAYSAPFSCLILFTDHSALFYSIQERKKGGMSLKGEMQCNIEMPTQATAVAATAQGCVIFGDVSGKLHMLTLSSEDGADLEVEIYSIKGARRLSAVRSILLDEMAERMYVLHYASEIAVYYLPEDPNRFFSFLPERRPYLLSSFYETSVEIQSVVQLSSNANPTLLGASSDGCFHWFDVSKRGAIECTASSHTITDALRRKRHDKVTLMESQENKVLVAMTDTNQTTPLTFLVWIWMSSSDADRRALVVEKYMECIRGDIWLFKRLKLSAPSNLEEVLMDLTTPEKLLTRQLFYLSDRHIVMTEEVYFSHVTPLPMECLCRVLEQQNAKGLQRFITIWGAAETVAMTFMLAATHGTNCTKYALQNKELTEAAATGFYIAFKRLMYPLWNTEMFQLRCLSFDRNIDNLAFEWYIRATKSFKKSLDTFLNFIKDVQRVVGVSEKLISDEDLNAIKNLRDLVSKCIQILVVGQIVSNSKHLNSRLLVTNGSLWPHWWTEVKNCPSLMIWTKEVWRLKELSSFSYENSPLSALLTTLIWRGWCPKCSDLVVLRASAPDFFNLLEQCEMCSLFRMLDI